jgi:hypothetical protein
VTPFPGLEETERPLLPSGARQSRTWTPAPIHPSTDSSAGHASSNDSIERVSAGTEEEIRPLRPAFVSRDSSFSLLHPASPSRPSSFLVPELNGLSGGATAGSQDSRYSAIRMSRASDLEYGASEDGYATPAGYRDSPQRSSTNWRESVASFAQQALKAATVESLLWDQKNAEQDDWLHHPELEDYKGRDMPRDAIPILRSQGQQHAKFQPLSIRGIANVLGITCLVGGIVGVFCFWPVATAINEMRNG